MAKKRKGAEGRIPHLAKRLRWGYRKYKDASYCPHCKQLQWKSERMPDYSLSPVIVYVEVKESLANERFSFKDAITQVQIDFFNKYPGYIFLEMGSGRAPKGKSAYMIPTYMWFALTDLLESDGFKSFAREESPRGAPGTDDLFEDWSCRWENGGWVIPGDHEWWEEIQARLEIALADVKAYKIPRRPDDTVTQMAFG